LDTPHIPVLFDEVLDSFKLVDDGYFVDCTLGYGGHSSGVLERYPNLKLIGIDRDDEALEFSANKLAKFGDRVELKKGSFSKVLPTIKHKPIVALLADFGVSSLQLDKKSRGFAFDSDVLDMRMDSSASFSAYEVVNEYPKDKLEYILNHYGEVKNYKKVVQAILNARIKSPIKSAKELSDIVVSVSHKGGKIHPATLAFQGIRIEVNDELGEIERLLDYLEDNHFEGEVVSLITFHSLEDRLVKNRFRKWERDCICDAHALRCSCGGNHSLGKSLNRKPITASSKELKINPRSRSAKLRSFRFDR
jgi:16S rRNA (cytosine1402-N4)-methyltransferase